MDMFRVSGGFDGDWRRDQYTSDTFAFLVVAAALLASTAILVNDGIVATYTTSASVRSNASAAGSSRRRERVPVVQRLGQVFRSRRQQDSRESPSIPAGPVSPGVDEVQEDRIRTTSDYSVFPERTSAEPAHISGFDDADEETEDASGGLGLVEMLEMMAPNDPDEAEEIRDISAIQELEEIEDLMNECSSSGMDESCSDGEMDAVLDEPRLGVEMAFGDEKGFSLCFQG
ncbi:hypothetical protein HDU82_002137 [Entophlyctis luteolus]|nr:hypothetical protein HDU82_002137 [Entophlyctis luteolus]